jgi:hypothetical protein
MMDKETFVYIDLNGAPHLVGRLWARARARTRKAPPSNTIRDGCLKVVDTARIDLVLMLKGVHHA